MKKLFSLVLVGFLSLLITTGCGCDKKKDDIKTDNDTPAVIGDVKFKKLDIIDFIVLYENNISTIYYTIENNTEETINYETINCEMYDKDNNLVYTLTSELGNLEPGQSKDIEMNVSTDLTKVVSVKYNVD